MSTCIQIYKCALLVLILTLSSMIMKTSLKLYCLLLGQCQRRNEHQQKLSWSLIFTCIIDVNDYPFYTSRFIKVLLDPLPNHQLNILLSYTIMLMYYIKCTQTQQCEAEHLSPEWVKEFLEYFGTDRLCIITLGQEPVSIFNNTRTRTSIKQPT